MAGADRRGRLGGAGAAAGILFAVVAATLALPAPAQGASVRHQTMPTSAPPPTFTPEVVIEPPSTTGGDVAGRVFEPTASPTVAALATIGVGLVLVFLILRLLSPAESSKRGQSRSRHW